MQEINWNNFRVKNKDPQKAFEELCYHLFCRKFNLVEGIRADFNEVGLETKTILFKKKYYGFQAKFFQPTNDAKQIKDSVEKAIKHFKGNLDVIYIYLNNPIGARARYDKNIESLAKKDNVEIIWIVPSNLKIILSQPKNQDLARLYFSLGKTIKEFIGELKQHTQSILEPIHSKIDFDGNEIKIDRSIIRKDLTITLKNSSVVILSGEGGVGKTAVIKDFYNDIEERTPIFIFKAVEFNISNINDLFKNYGDFTLLDFINEHKDINEKYIVIDSAEKLSDLEDQEAFQEFLSVLFKNKWKIIFTTRHSYLDDLKFQLVGIYRLNFQLLNIKNIDLKELGNLSSKYDFTLPKDDRLLELLRTPFYLNEYLQNYNKIEEKIIDYTTFKKILWNKKILNSPHTKDNLHLNREKCFLKIAKNRADSGHFFVSVDDFDNKALQKLEDDEIIKYDSDNDGYFITYEIYEEWALEKIIERNFNKSGDYKNFFDSLGSSLPIRRAFRNWLSEQLLINKDEVKFLIEESIINDEIKSFWKDEILVSILLSDYSRVFFQIFENKLLENNQELLMRISFLIRIACKEIDEGFLNLLGLQKTVGIALKTLFTKPKGNGWNCVIDFIHKHKQEFGLHNINIILLLLDDWNNKNKDGDTTKKASQIALFYYDEIAKNGGFWYNSRDEKKEQLIRVILQGASEINDELKTIFDEVISQKQTSHRDKYYKLIQTILSSITDNFEVIKCLPEYVIKLADLFWFQLPKKVGIYEHHSIGVEKYFGLSEKHDFDYFPASAFQTPVFQLLRFAPNETVDFILSFTNKTVECYAKSELNNEIEEVEVFIDKVKPIKQYISHRLWNMYRGTQVSTYLLGSIHMALEKWLLENAKSTSNEILESWCLYLIKNSKSASITAVVTSIVLANPSKLFNIARILFQTKEFFIYDTGRMSQDQTAESLYSIGKGLNIDFKNEIYQNERIKTCRDKHRNRQLEYLALNYQFLKAKDNNEFEKQREALWEILDNYYKKLPPESKQSKEDKTWRLYLARMDSRKMMTKVESEKNGDRTIVTFNPKIDPKLKKFSEDSLKSGSDAMKYASLKLWSDFRFRREEDKYQQYQQYENNPQSVIAETKEIIEGLKNKTEDTFFLFNHSIPAYTCSVLVRDYFDRLNNEEKEFCKEVIIEFSSAPLQTKHYQYQISDGTEPTIIILPDLIKHFPKDKEEVKSLLLLLLLNPWREISTFATSGILHNLWEINFDDAHAIFLGYLLLKPKYDDLRDEIRKENYQKNVYKLSEVQVLECFIKKYGNELKKIVSNRITYNELDDLEKLDLETLKTAFELLPLKTENEDHKKFLNIIFPVFSKRLFLEDNRVDYTLKHRFLEKLAYFILNSTKNEIETYLKPFVDNFSNSRDMADFFHEFITVEDRLNKYEEFWIVWNAFYEKIVEICKKQGSYHYTKEIVHNYLLAWPYWKEDAREWHTLKEREKSFYKKVAEDIGHHPSVLYSISKILNDIGSNFIEDGIVWISNILQKNNQLISGELETNTIYYIENIIRRYVLTNRKKIKTTLQIKNQVIVILNFLVERGSIMGYLLREDIL